MSWFISVVFSTPEHAGLNLEHPKYNNSENDGEDF